MPNPTQEDVEWAYLLWNSLADHGRWVLPGVGVYTKTAERELTLTEIHFSKPSSDEFGNSVFDRHHWIMLLGDNIGWTINENVVLAKDEDGVLNIPQELVGHVSVCKQQCGTILRVEEPNPNEVYEMIGEDLRCPCCNEEDSIDEKLRGVHVIVDDRAWHVINARNEEEE